MATQSALPMLTATSGRRFFLSPDGETIIGSSGCAVLLSKPGVVPRHARVVVFQGQYWVEDLGGGVQLNGQRVTARTRLQNGDMITIVAEQLIFHAGTAIPHTTSAVAANTQSPPTPSLGTQAPPPQFGQPRAPAPQTPWQSPQPQAQLPPAPFPGLVPAHPTGPVGLTPPQQTITSVPRHLNSLGQPQVEGQVILVDGPHMEEPDPNIGIMVAKAVLWIFLLPLLIWRPGLISLILFGRKDTRIPTRYLRVRDQNGQNIMVRMKGEPTRGSITQGDHISCWGRWDGGTLQLGRAFNHQINADVQFR